MIPFRVLSWGCGLQSTLLGEMSAQGLLPHLDAILTADLGFERQVTYDVRDWYAKRWRRMGMHVEIIQAGDIRMQGATAHIHIPFWTSDGGPLQRQCTRNFKIWPVKRRIRELMGYHRSDPPHPKPGAVELWIGFTTDEWMRATRSRVKFIKNRWPLLELKIHRLDCIAWFRGHALPVPPKSACICCPYRRASEWIEMRDEAPEEFAAAIAFDEANRDNPLAEHDGSTCDALYIWHTSDGPEPLLVDNLEFEAAKERRIYGTQLPMFGCGTGFCGT